jgi:hypothetical protein
MPAAYFRGMSKLPRADDLPHASEGYDPARVEEAFSVFAERVRALEAVASELRSELHSLRADRSAPTRFDAERWPAEPGGTHPSPDWIAAVPAPLARDSTMPRLALEGVFLVLVALFAGLADLAAVWIVLVMVAAWGLVVLSEWAAAAKRARWRLDEVAPPAAGRAADTTGPWNMPIVGATVVDPGLDPESKTMVTKLPPDPEEPEPAADDGGMPAPAGRRGLRRRKLPVEAGAADPWEA